jgi:hypothetical protein
VVVLSEDGLATLKLSRGTQVLAERPRQGDAEGQPLAPVSVRVMAMEVPLRADIAVVGLAYEFSPAGATLAPPASLTVRYNPHAYYPFAYQSVDCSQLHMAYFDEKGPLAPWLDVKMDSEAHSVTAEIDHLGTLIIFCEVFGMPIS